MTVALAPTHPAALGPIRTADDLAAAYLIGFGESTRSAYARDLRAWGAWLATVGLGPLDAHRAHVETWMRIMEADGLAPATVARRLAALSGFYSYALDEELIGRNPTARVRRPRPTGESPRSGLDRDQARALLAVAESSTARDRALVTLLVLSGLRVSEALGIDVADLDIERGHRTIRIRRKGGKVQRLALAPRTAAAIDALLAGRTEGPIFTTASGRRLDRHAAWKTVRRLAKRAGLERPLSPHALRHTHATLALDAGAELHVVQDSLGHADSRTTMRYVLGRERLDNAATFRLAAHLAAE